MTKKHEQHNTQTLPESSRKCDDSVKNSNTGRITSSSFAIAWSIVLLVLFTFFHQYIAYYEPETIGGVSKWIRYPILTEAFFSWLPILVATLVLFIIGHIILIYFDKYLLQETVLTVLSLFVVVTVLSLLFIFPFDFTRIPHVEMASVLYPFTRIALIGAIVVLGVGTLVKLIKLIVGISMPKTS